MMPQTVRFITVGNLKESYLREAAAEYKKRLSGMCRVEEVELKEVKLPEDPSESEIKKALSEEAKAILAAIPPRSFPIALCVEGKLRSSEEVAGLLSDFGASSSKHLVFLIGGSYGLDAGLKREADVRLSMSPMTFPHHLARVMLLEQVYRACQINVGTRYHK